MISPNLRAALEFDEQTRASAETLPGLSSRRPSLASLTAPAPPDPNPAPPTSGLPPPPRPKSRASSLYKSKSPPMTPTSPFTGLQQQDTTAGAAASASSSPASASGPGHENISTMGTGMTASNPYINPTPRLSQLYGGGSSRDRHGHSATSSHALTHSRSFSLPDNVVVASPRSSDGGSPVARTSPRGESASKHSPIPIAASPDGAPAGSGTASNTPEGTPLRAGFQRHLRYLSSLHRVEKMLVKSKTRAVGKGSDGTGRIRNDDGSGRRGGSVSSSSEINGEQDRDMVRELGMVTGKAQGRRIRKEGVASSAPCSPINPAMQHRMSFSVALRCVALSPWTRLLNSFCFAAADAGSTRLPEKRLASRRSVGIGLLPEAEPTAGVRLPLRQLISHGRRGSAASTAASSEESHEPPQTPDDTAISISSTIYHGSPTVSYNDAHIHHDAPLTPPYDDASTRSATMDSDRDSFIDLASPTFSPRLIDFSSNAPHSHTHYRPYTTDPHNTDSLRSRVKPVLPAISTAISSKPPIPTSPKPDFKRRSRSAQPPPDRRDATLDSPSVQEVTYTRVRPPHTNLLNPIERAEKIRSTRKLAQVFGQTPASSEAVAMSHLAYEANVPSGLLCAPSNGLMLLSGKRSLGNLKHHRGAVSMSVAEGGSDAPQPLWPPPEPDASRYVALSARRHSTPLTPETFMFMEDEAASPDRSSVDSGGSRHSSDVIEVSSRRGTPHSDWGSHAGHGRSAGPGSPTSFMDLSEEDILADGLSSITTVETPRADRRPGLVHSSSSSVYSFTSEDLAEEDRRRKREKLAKLHRFLGSRVPVDVVLGQLSIGAAVQTLDLPPISDGQQQPQQSQPQPQQHTYARMDTDTRKTWARRRRSSSAGELGHKWSDDVDRLKEELNDKEKAQNVKRAIKMEKVCYILACTPCLTDSSLRFAKMFGVAPPQTLYHTRAAPPPSGSANSHHASSASTSAAAQYMAAPHSPSSPTSRNMNQGAYMRNKVKRHARPGTADSTEPLISHHGNGRLGSSHGFSDIYEHYRHSLNSLNDILDRVSFSLCALHLADRRTG